MIYGEVLESLPPAQILQVIYCSKYIEIVRTISLNTDILIKFWKIKHDDTICVQMSNQASRL